MITLQEKGPEMVVITFRAFYLCSNKGCLVYLFYGLSPEYIKTHCACLRHVRRHYEPGRRDRCYKEVWRRYVYPVYPMCYRTFLNYIGVNIHQERTRNEDRQLSLF